MGSPSDRLRNCPTLLSPKQKRKRKDVIHTQTGKKGGGKQPEDLSLMTLYESENSLRQKN